MMRANPPIIEHAAPPSPSRERRWLQTLHRRFHRAEFIPPDPLETLAAAHDPADREVIALVASSLAYGSVIAMRPAIRTVLDLLGARPAHHLATCSPRDLTAQLRGFRYRFTDGRTMAALLVAARRVRSEHGSLEVPAAQARRSRDPQERGTESLTGFAAALRAASPAPLDHLLPHPGGGSACKRLCLLFRWMVRCDCIDPGGWTLLSPRDLLMPVDVHVHRAARTRGWTLRATADLRTAIDITRFLARISPDDPLRYDFAMTRPGILRVPDDR